MPKFTETTYLLGIWIITAPPCAYPHGGDFTMFVFKDDIKDEEWKLESRFREYANDDPSAFNDPDDPYGSIDKKTWYCATSKGTEEEILEKTNKMVAKVVEGSKKKFGTEELNHDSVIVRGGYDKFVTVMTNNPKPWLHCKVVRQVDSDGTHSE